MFECLECNQEKPIIIDVEQVGNANLQMTEFNSCEFRILLYNIFIIQLNSLFQTYFRYIINNNIAAFVTDPSIYVSQNLQY